jgi:hypothetical protein
VNFSNRKNGVGTDGFILGYIFDDLVFTFYDFGGGTIIPDPPDFLRFIMTSSQKIRLPNIQHGTRGLAGSIESLIAFGSGIHRDRVHGVSGYGVLWVFTPF